MQLLAPPAWSRLKPHERSRLINGCGGAGTWTRWLVPDSIWGIDVYPACARHDVAYATGCPKSRADIMLLCNLLILCGRGSRWLLPLRALRCLTYYLAVTFFGRRFYGRKLAHKQLRGRGRG